MFLLNDYNPFNVGFLHKREGWCSIFYVLANFNTFTVYAMLMVRFGLNSQFTKNENSEKLNSEAMSKVAAVCDIRFSVI